MIGASRARELLERHGLAARRDLGQNFVTDPGVVRRMVRIAGVGPASRVLEVGPGLGSLTLALVEAGAEVLAVEKDPGVLAALEEVLDESCPQMAAAGPRPVVLRADALEVDWPEVLGGSERVMVANLPYNVAVPIILRVLETAPTVGRLVVMVQLEVAERLCATPGGRSIGVPTVKVGWWASARLAMTVPPEVFVPRPRVRSAVVDITRRAEPTEGDRATAFELVDTAFGQRRKMLRSSLRGVLDAASIEAAGVDPRARPEQLTVPDWARLSARVAAT